MVTFLQAFLETPSGEAPNHLFLDFGDILGYILELFYRLFPSCCKPLKMQPLQCESSVLEVLGVQIFMIVCSILQDELQDRLLTSFLEVLATFVAPFWEPPGIHFDFFDSFF